MTKHKEIFAESRGIDGLDTSVWGSENVYRNLRDGGVTAVNATIAIWAIMKPPSKQSPDI